MIVASANLNAALNDSILVRMIGQNADEKPAQIEEDFVYKAFTVSGLTNDEELGEARHIMAEALVKDLATSVVVKAHQQDANLSDNILIPAIVAAMTNGVINTAGHLTQQIGAEFEFEGATLIANMGDDTLQADIATLIALLVFGDADLDSQDPGYAVKYLELRAAFEEAIAGHEPDAAYTIELASELASAWVQVDGPKVIGKALLLSALADAHPGFSPEQYLEAIDQLDTLNDWRSAFVRN